MDLSKNNAESSFEKREIESGFWVLICKNKTEETEIVKAQFPVDLIQFHFCQKAQILLSFNEGKYKRALDAEASMLLYNPNKQLPIDLEILPGARSVSFLIAIEKFHRLFSKDASYIDFLKEGKRDKKYYQERKISPALSIVLNQILNFNLNTSVIEIYLKGKIYEGLGLYFSNSEQYDFERCPFLVDEDNVRKIKNAKNIVLENLANPPSLKELSEEIGLSLKKLKEGFKEVYGDTVYRFLLDYKMEYARKLLEDGRLNVNEVGLKIGYSTASHFITAFKKKYGTTPKKYMQSIKMR